MNTLKNNNQYFHFIELFTAPLLPPAKKARFPADVATKLLRGYDKLAVVHLLLETL